MKKYKKNILIIGVAFFVLLGMSWVATSFAMDDYQQNWQGDRHDTEDSDDHTEMDSTGGGGTTGDTGGGTTEPGTGNGDDQGQRIKRSASSSITIKVVNKEPVCSTETYYKCEIGEVVESSKKQDTERGKDLYTWQCEGGEGTTPVPCVFSKTEPEPNQLACGDFSYIDNNNWKGGCKGGNLVEGSKEHDLTTNTFSWKCQGDSPEKIIPCKHTLELDGICGSSPYSCLEGEVKGEKYKNDLFNWECHGYNGGETDYCEYINEEEPNPIDGICGEKLYGCNEGKLNKLSEKIDGYYWECLGRNGGEKDSCFEKKPSINGQCGPAQGQHYSSAPKEKDLCLTGEIVGPTKTGENNSWTWQCAGSNGGKTANCQTLLISLSPKFSGCYIKEGESSCEPEDKYSWIASGLDSLLSLFTNMGIFKLDSYSGSRSLSIKYPMSDIFLKRGEEELAQSRAWAICGHGLYWEEKRYDTEQKMLLAFASHLEQRDTSAFKTS